MSAYAAAKWIVLGVVLIGAGVVGSQLYDGTWTVPSRWNPWAPYDVNRAAGPVTPIQFWRTVHDSALCAAALDRSGMQFRPVADFATPTGCSVSHAVMIERDRLPQGATVIRFSHPFIAACPLALALARFDRETVEPAAVSMYGQPVTEIDHVGSYACRDVRTDRAHAVTALSQHAYANALDITGFALADGQRFSIARDWLASASARRQTGDTKAAAFLVALHDGACRAFDTTLGPGYNALHQTHFHVDMGPYRICD